MNRAATFDPRTIDERVDALTAHAGAAHRGGLPPDIGAFRRIVAAVDGHAGAHAATQWATALAKLHGGGVTLVHAVPELEEFTRYETLGFPEVREIQERRRAWARALLAEARDDVALEGVTHEEVLSTRSPVTATVAVAWEHDADLVVTGSHRHGWAGRVFLGSVSDGILKTAPTSVLVAKTTPPPSAILAAVDGSWQSKLAAVTAIRLADAWRVPCTLHHVFDLPHGDIDAARDVLDGIARDLTRPWEDDRIGSLVTFGDPAKEIVRVADAQGVDLIVVGARGLGGLATNVPGSVSTRVAHHASASVLVVRPPGHAPQV